MNFSTDFSVSEKFHWDFDIAIGLLNSLLKGTFARQISEGGGIFGKRNSMIEYMKR